MGRVESGRAEWVMLTGVQQSVVDYYGVEQCGVEQSGDKWSGVEHKWVECSRVGLSGF